MSTEERPGVDDPNDQELDSLLRQALQRESARSIEGPTPDCVEAETVAAWSDGALTHEQARAVEAHAARCGRCQAMLAAFARSAPVAEAAVRPAAVPDEASEVSVWRWWRAGWLVPVAATAAALAIWVATPSRSVPETSTEVALQSNPAPMEPAGVVPEPESRRRAEPTPDRYRAPAAPASPAPLQRRSASAAENAEPAAQVDNLRQRAEPAEVSIDAAASANAAPTIAPSSSAGVREEAMPREAPAASAAGALADKRADAPVPPPPLAGLARAAAPGTARVVVEVASGDRIQWRIRQGATMGVEFSDSGGREWAAAAVPEGESAAVVAGAAAGGRVCWLVGRRGVVLLTTDGVSFQRVPFPDPADLTFVSAVDARRATVRAVDGRTFTTADGGATWVAARP